MLITASIRPIVNAAFVDGRSRDSTCNPKHSGASSYSGSVDMLQPKLILLQHRALSTTGSPRKTVRRSGNANLDCRCAAADNQKIMKKKCATTAENSENALVAIHDRKGSQNPSACKIELFRSNFSSSSIHMRSYNVPFSSSTTVRQALSLVTIASHSACGAPQRDVSAYKHTARRQILAAKRARQVLINCDRAARLLSAIRRPGSISNKMTANLRSGIPRWSFVVMSVRVKAGLRVVEQRRRSTFERRRI
jgi:hypothetical protein